MNETPKLKIRKPDYVGTIDYSDLDRFVTTVYGLAHRWSVVADQEWHNDSSYTVSARAETLDAHDLNDLAEFKQGKGIYHLGIILTDLCTRGLIEPGKYIIDVRW